MGKDPDGLASAPSSTFPGLSLAARFTSTAELARVAECTWTGLAWRYQGRA